MKKLLAGLFIFGFLFGGVQNVHASILSDALLQIQNLKKEIAQLKASLKGSAGDILAPTLVNYPILDVGQDYAILGMEITSRGTPAVTTPLSIYYGKTSNPTVSSVSIPLSIHSIYQYKISGLTCGTKYYYYGKLGTSNSVEDSFTTKNCTGYVDPNPVVYLPVIASTSTSSITSSGVIINSNVSASLSPISQYGVCWKKTGGNFGCLPEQKSATSSFSLTLYGLDPSTTYTYYTYAISEYGTGTSSQSTFTTSAVSSGDTSNTKPANYSSPRVEIYPAPAGLTSSTATPGGYVTSLGSTGAISERGACYGISASSITNCKIAYSVQGPNDMYLTKFEGLTPNTTYYYKMYAKNAYETVYSTSSTFKTLADTLTPVNGGWSAWSDSSSCVAASATSTYGYKNQVRTCTNPALANGGANCSGPSSQTVYCTVTPTPGNWSAWSDSGSCVAASATSTYGYKTQTRTCTNPAPTNGGTCSGVSSQTVYCTVTPTPSKPQCSDGIDNDKDGLIDTSDGMCHLDSDMLKAYVSTHNSETVFPTDSNSPLLKVSYPQGGEVFKSDDKITVKWESKNVIAGTVGLLLFDSNNQIKLNVYPTLNDGIETITLPQVSGTNFKIMISNDQTGGAYSNPFTINSATTQGCDATLSASDTTITLGETTTLSWGSHNCSAVYIPSVGTTSNLGISGTKVVSPTMTTDYVLTAMASSTDFIKKTVRVTVNPANNNGCTGGKYSTTIAGYLCPVEGSTLPVVSINPVTSFTSTTATIGATVTSMGNPAATASSMCIDTSSGKTGCATIGISTNLSRNLTGLTPNTKYYYSGNAISSFGTGWSSVGSFTTLPKEGLCSANVPAINCPAFQTEAVKDANGCIVAFVCKDMTKSAEIPSGDGCLPGYKYSTTIANYVCPDNSSLKSANMLNQNNNVANTTNPGTRTLKQGVIGEDVKSLQMYLGIGADGVFGRGTAKAVREWQAANGLNPDGYFGKASYRKMNGEE